MRITAVAVTVVAALAMLVSMVLPPTTAPPTSSTPPTTATSPVSDLETMKAEVAKQLQAANDRLDAEVKTRTEQVQAITAKDIEQDERIAALEKRVSTLETQMATAKADIKALQNRLRSVEDGEVTLTGVPLDLTTDQTAQALADALVAAGWQPDQIKVGKVDWSKNPYDVGRETFVDRQIRTQQDLARVLSNPQNAAEKAVRKHIKSALKDLPESERERAMTGQGFVPVQFMEEVCFTGNTFYAGGKAHREGDVCKKAGDIWWVYVGSDGTVHWDASVRADCGNPGVLKPPRPKHPKPTPTPTKTPKPSPTPTPTKPTKTPEPTPTPDLSKAPAPQPTGVEKPTGNPVAPTPTAKPTPKPTPLKPTPAPTSAAPTDEHKPSEGQPNEGGTPTNTGGAASDG